MTEKITDSHRCRKAYVYIRQSSQFQVENNRESAGLQYALVDRAKALGFAQVELVDEDQGCSGSGVKERKGFERLLAAVCLKKVGAVFSMEASRLARNNRDWHHLIELCSLTGTLIVDGEAIYDPHQLNDRLLLGLKGTMSEFELSLFRQRSLAARMAKAKRGELFGTIAAGFICTSDNRCEKDPDLRIQQSIETIFKKFAEMGSAKQVFHWCRDEKFLIPHGGPHEQTRPLPWKMPAYHTIHAILKNPIYAGAYAYGRTGQLISMVEGRARKKRKLLKMDRWSTLIKEHHEGYISWNLFMKNQAQLRDNASRYGRDEVRGAARRGNSLLAGLLRCGQCGRKMQVRYASSAGYKCIAEFKGTHCSSLGHRRIDTAIGEKILEVIQPAGIEAALLCVAQAEAEQDEKRRAKELALEQARYESERAARQFHASEPENRLVASTLEKRWNAALEHVQALESELNEVPVRKEMSEEERESLIKLGEDLPRVWHDENSAIGIKKRMARVLIEEIIVNTHKSQDSIDVVIRWAGGQHSSLQVRKVRAGEHRYTTDKETVQLVRELSEVMCDGDIARELNRLGRKTGHGNTWKQNRICALRNENGIAFYDPEKRKERGLVTMQGAAKLLGICSMSVKRLIDRKIIVSKQVIPGAPRMITKEQMNTPIVKAAVKCMKLRKKIPLTGNQNQETLSFQ